MDFKAILVKGETKTEILLNAEQKNGDTVLTLPAASVGSGYDYIDLFPDAFTATRSDDGYFIIPENYWSRLVRFSPDGMEGHFDSDHLGARIFAFLKNGVATTGFVTGMRVDFRLVCGLKGDHYYYFLRFPLEGEVPYEDISITLHTATGEEADYNGMAIWYRNYGLINGYFTSLAEKIATRETMRYATESICIRIRMGWKPAPAEVLYQTRENEPEMKVACTFAMVEELIDELKAEGVEKAEICLVGWNVRGHDGRWPEMFPVEPALGGEEGLKKLLKKAEAVGYVICLHSNVTAAYSIAENFSEDFIIKNPDGSLALSGSWSGGQAHKIALPYWEKQYVDNLKKLAAIGKFGTHYVDVLSGTSPRKSFDPVHPMSRKDFCDSCDRVLGTLQELFGASASEGGGEHCIKHLDYAFAGQGALRDRSDGKEWMGENIPLWSLIFHGILLYNASALTINYAIKEHDIELVHYEYGGRPLGYCFVNFVRNAPHWGVEDLVWENGETPTQVAKVLAGMYHDYVKTLMPLQTVFMKRHDVLPDGSSIVTYENGAKVIVNYQTGEYSVQNP